MVASKKVHCAYCRKKCTGNVLRYQDQYYHKHCFELEQQTAPAPPPVQPDETEVELERHLNRAAQTNGRSATLPHSISTPPSGGGFLQAASNGSSGHAMASQTLDGRQRAATNGGDGGGGATTTTNATTTTCAGCRERIVDGQALIALDLHWHVWCFKCAQCRAPLHGEYVAKEGRAYCERDYQKLFGITCVYCKRYITGKVLQAGEAHHFHPSCARCSKCGDPFVPGEEMYLQAEVTWHPRCGPGPNGAAPPASQAPESSLLDADSRSQLRNSRAQSPSLSSRSRSASPYSYMSRQCGRSSPAYADSEAVGDLSRIYTISYLNADPNQGYLRRPIEPSAPKSPQFSRPTSLSRLGGQGSTRSQRDDFALYGSSTSGVATSQLGGGGRERSAPRGMYSLLSGMGRSQCSSRARSPSMMNEEAIQLAAYPSGQKPAPNSLAKIERDDFPAPPFPYPDARHHASGGRRAHSAGARHNGAAAGAAATNGNNSVHLEDDGGEQLIERGQSQQQQQRASRPRSREIKAGELELEREDSLSSGDQDPQFRKEEEELSKIANGIGKIFLQTLKEREKLRAWKRANLDPRNASRTPSATRELPSRMRYENPANASPSRDMDRPRQWGGGGGGDEELGDELGGQSPTQTRSSLGKSATLLSDSAPGPPPPPAPHSALSSAYGYKVVQANRATPRPGYGLTTSGRSSTLNGAAPSDLHLSFAEQQRVAAARANDLLGRQHNGATAGGGPGSTLQSEFGAAKLPNFTASGSMRSLSSAAHLRRSMPNVASLHQQQQQQQRQQQSAHAHSHQEGPPKLYPYHLLATSNYRLPPEVDRCHLERHLSTEEFQYIFHCDRLDFYRLPEWRRNELKRRARLF